MVLTPRSRRFGFRVKYFSPSSTKNSSIQLAFIADKFGFYERFMSRPPQLS